MAEERERRVRATFNRFDLDRSGDINMDELLVMSQVTATSRFHEACYAVYYGRV